MKITALEIRQKTFEKEFRGVNKAEVSAFLLSLSHAWESMVKDNKELKVKLEQSEKEVQKLREIENSLFKTLKTAETTGATMVEQANRSAELLMRETKLKAEQLYATAQQKSDDVIVTMQDEIRTLEKEFRSLENYRDDLIRQIKSIANESIEKVSKISNDRKDLNFIKEKAQNTSSINEKPTFDHFETPQLEVPNPTPIIFEEPSIDEIDEESSISDTPEMDENQDESHEIEEKTSKKDDNDNQKSFFDEITE